MATTTYDDLRTMPIARLAALWARTHIVMHERRDERVAMIRAMRTGGMGCTDIGRFTGLTYQRVRQILLSSGGDPKPAR